MQYLRGEGEQQRFDGGASGAGSGPRGEGGGGSGFDSTSAGTLEAGSRQNPGNKSDPLRGSAGEGGEPTSTSGQDGSVVICYL